MNEPVYCKIISIDWQSALLAYDTGQMGEIHVEVSCRHGNRILKIESEEVSGCGRLELLNLESATHYQGTFSWQHGKKTFTFQSLEAPEGSMLDSFAVVADPHVSVKKENRKGRFFVESAMIFKQVIHQCNELGVSMTFIPGDLTNDGLKEEYNLVGKALKSLNSKLVAVPGNHDCHDEKSRAYWDKYFPKNTGIVVTSFGIVVSVDTADAELSPYDAELIVDALEKADDKPVIILSHYQLLENAYINRGSALKAIKNAGDHKKVFEKLYTTPTIIYAGHQNILSVKHYGRTTQINLPQPTQYPCGFTLVKHFINGYYHQFIPIESEVLRQWSRRSSDQAVKYYNEPQWDTSYRGGNSLSDSNFIVKG